MLVRVFMTKIYIYIYTICGMWYGIIKLMLKNNTRDTKLYTKIYNKICVTIVMTIYVIQF